MTHVRAVAMLVAAISLFAFGYAVNGLAEGITELPRHWWSMAPVAGLFTAAVLEAAGRLARR